MRLRRINQWEIVPAGWGAAWPDWSQMQIVILPIPLNIIASRLRNAWIWMLNNQGFVSKAERDAYGAGFDRGFLFATKKLEK